MRTAPPRSKKAASKARSAPAPAAKPAAGRIARRVRESYGLSRESFTRLSGFSTRAIANWESGRQEPKGEAKRRLHELERLRAALARIMSEDTIAAWLDTPGDAFGGLKPIEVIERGQVDRVWEMVFRMESGAVV